MDNFALESKEKRAAAFSEAAASMGVSHEKLEKELRKDYDDMREMIFNDSPSFEKVLEQISRLETEINNI